MHEPCKFISDAKNLQPILFMTAASFHFHVGAWPGSQAVTTPKASERFWQETALQNLPPLDFGFSACQNLWILILYQAPDFIPLQETRFSNTKIESRFSYRPDDLRSHCKKQPEPFWKIILTFIGNQKRTICLAPSFPSNGSNTNLTILERYCFTDLLNKALFEQFSPSKRCIQFSPFRVWRSRWHSVQVPILTGIYTQW
jgi:hypothetical protein